MEPRLEHTQLCLQTHPMSAEARVHDAHAIAIEIIIGFFLFIKNLVNYKEVCLGGGPELQLFQSLQLGNNFPLSTQVVSSSTTNMTVMGLYVSDAYHTKVPI